MGETFDMLQRIPASLRGRNTTLAVKRCIVCDEKFQYPATYTTGYATCSPSCTSANRRGTPVVRDCLECGDIFTPRSKGSRGRAAKFCGDPCRMIALQRIPRTMKDRGEGWLDDQGHVVIAAWRGGERRIMKRARLVVSTLLGRELTTTEVIHHINLIPDDDRPSNLWLCRDQAEHMRLHAFTDRLQSTNLITFPETASRQPTGAGEDKMVGGQQEIIEANQVLGGMGDLDPRHVMRQPVVPEHDIADPDVVDAP